MFFHPFYNLLYDLLPIKKMVYLLINFFFFTGGELYVDFDIFHDPLIA